MRILAPLKGFEQIDALISANPDEVYLSFVDNVWNNKYGDFNEINRMSSFGPRANFIGQNNAMIAIRKMNNAGIKCYLAINSPSYSDSQNAYLKQVIDSFAKLGCGFIVGTLSLAAYCAENNYQCTISTMSGIYNSLSVKALLDLGVKRIIFPRDISIENMAKIVSKYPSIEYEAFLMRNGCRYSDSNCLSFHARRHNSLCYYLDNSKTQMLINNTVNKFDFYGNHSIYKNVFHKKACGLCSIYRLIESGITAVKIVGRADNPSELIEDICLAKQSIDLAQHCSTEQMYLEQMTLSDGILEQCLYGLNCYYPCIRF